MKMPGGWAWSRGRTTPKPRPRFLLGDWMVLVAALALASLALRVTNADGELLWDRAAIAAAYRPVPSLWAAWYRFDMFGPTVLSVACLALLILQWRHAPRGMGRLASRPGFVACLAALVGLLYETVINIGIEAFIVNARNGFRATFVAGGRSLTWLEALKFLAFPSQFVSPYTNAVAVLASWVALWGGGRRRWRHDWLDGLGVACGFGWIVMSIFYRIVLTWYGP